jgi:hypothetical protein
MTIFWIGAAIVPPLVAYVAIIVYVAINDIDKIDNW